MGTSKAAYTRSVLDSGAAAQLFLALVGDTPLERLVADANTVPTISAVLQPLRDRHGLEILSLAINGQRVDVVARGGEDEWRVVFGIEEGPRVGWVSVFRRVAPFEGVAKGRAVVVNGPSSVGKSTLLEELQARSDVPWVVFDEPTFGAVKIEYLIWREQCEVLHRGFVDGIAALARAGNCVAVAAGGHPQSLFDAALVGVPTVRVGLYCAVAELIRREQGRRDVPGGLAVSSLDVHGGWEYQLSFDTTTDSISDIATQVLLAADALSEQERNSS